MTSKVLFAAAASAVFFLGASTASAATFILKDSGLGLTNDLVTTGELTGGNAAVAASASGVAFTDMGFFTISTQTLVTSFSVSSHGTSNIGEISGGTAALYKFDGSSYVLLPDTVINLASAPAGMTSQLASFSNDFTESPGQYAIKISSTGVDTVASQRMAKYSVELDGVAVPEPSTWALAMVGVGLVGTSLRVARRRKASQTAA